jgi:hypothetical protein
MGLQEPYSGIGLYDFKRQGQSWPHLARMGDLGVKGYIMYSASCTCGRVMGPTVKSALDEAVRHHKSNCPDWEKK